MSDFTFLFNRKGALYPLDFTSCNKNSQCKNTETSSEAQKPNNNIQSTGLSTSEWPFNSIFDSTLVHLCSKVIVNMPNKEIDRITDSIPAELFVPLFKASLYPVKDNAIDVRTFFFCVLIFFYIIKGYRIIFL
jgi:hypothetical protein